MRGVTVSDLNDCIITSIIMGIGLVFEIQYDSSQCPQPQYSTKASSFPPLLVRICSFLNPWTKPTSTTSPHELCSLQAWPQSCAMKLMTGSTIPVALVVVRWVLMVDIAHMTHWFKNLIKLNHCMNFGGWSVFGKRKQISSIYIRNASVSLTDRQ